MAQKIPVAVIGATGYTGLELMRILVTHPHVEIASLTARQYEGQKFSDVYPAFTGWGNWVCEKLDVASIAKKVSCAFLCLPHHESMEVARQFRDQNVLVIDLSADFRLTDVATYEKWYGPHTQQALLKEAVYGLPELHADRIKGAKLIASPGCYVTSVILGLAPLLKNKLIELKGIVSDSKSGTSGAGRAAKVDKLFCEVNESFSPYGTGQHRHTPEMEQELSLLAGGEVQILFSPHLLPIDRGILSSIYAQPTRHVTTDALHQAFLEFYAEAPFVKVLLPKQFPSLKNVRGTNDCHLSPMVDERTGRVVVFSAIDNLTKGASGQAVQSFNLTQGFPEDTGLKKIALIP